MKTWVTLGLLAVGGYLLYNVLFAPGEAREEAPASIEFSSAAAPEPAVEAAADPEPASTLRLDIGGAQADASGRAADEAAWGLFRERDEARRTGAEDRARSIEDRILREHTASDPARWIGFERGREAFALYQRLGRNEEGLQHAACARRLLTPALFIRDVEPAERTRLRETLAELAEAVLFTTRHVEGVDRVYVPRSGENLGTLCSKTFRGWGSRVTPGFLCSVNGLASPSQLRAGEPLKVPAGEPRIVVVKREFRLYYLFDGAYADSWPVGLGKEGSTPAATFEIGTKLKNPDWYPRPGVKIPYGDPRNILGTRWLGFRNTTAYRGFGIHGTPDPSSIGKEESSGCLRLLRDDVERLYDWTPEGTPVDILP